MLYRSSLIRLNSLNVRNEIWGRYLRMSGLPAGIEMFKVKFSMFKCSKLAIRTFD